MTKVVIIGELEIGGEKHPAVVSGDITFGEGPPPAGVNTKAPEPIEPPVEPPADEATADADEPARHHRRR